MQLLSSICQEKESDECSDGDQLDENMYTWLHFLFSFVLTNKLSNVLVLCDSVHVSVMNH